MDEETRQSVLSAIKEDVDVNKGGINLVGADLGNENLRASNLYEAHLRGANLHRADLTVANLRGADLRDANLSQSHLSYADLSGADLRGTDLREARRCRTNFSLAVYDNSTRFPYGFDPVAAGMVRINTMKLWLLRPVEDLPDDNNPWEPWYEKTFGFLVRAESEQEARRLAHDNADGENHCRTANTTQPWLEQQYSTCIELLAEGERGIIISDFARA